MIIDLKLSKVTIQQFTYLKNVVIRSLYLYDTSNKNV